MNFLAHAYLSGNNPKILVGNFIGDFVKGRQALSEYDPMIAKGISLHRFIDEYTDNHAIVKDSKNRLREKYRHYANVIVDVYYDHFLAVSWSTYHTMPLKTFSAFVYDTVRSFDAILPEGVKYMLPYMINGNWLYNYSTLEGINRALTGMSRRTSFDSKMDEAVQDLKKDYKLYQAEFDAFFPAIDTACKQWLVSEKI